jgi:hypothetical protein
MEFPLYPAAVAIAMSVVDSEHPGVGKGVALLAMAGSLLGLGLLVQRVTGLPRWAAVLAASFSPFAWVYASKVKPESLAIALCAWGTWSYRVARDATARGPRLGWAALAALLIATGILVRPYVAGIASLLAVDAVASLRRRSSPMLPVAIGMSALVAPALWYAVWCPHLIRTYGMTYFFFGAPSGEIVRDLTTRGTWRALVEVVGRDHIGPALAVPFALGLVLAVRGRMRGALALLATGPITLVAVLALSGDHFAIHGYFLSSLLLPLAAGGAVGIVWVRDRWPRLALPLVSIAFLVVAWTTRESREESPRYAEIPSGPWPARNERVVAEELDGTLSFVLAATGTRGWVATREQVHSGTWCAARAAEGARWVLHRTPRGLRAAPMDEWRRGVAADPGSASPADPRGAPKFVSPDRE